MLLLLLLLLQHSSMTEHQSGAWLCAASATDYL
jgi:hypothetical protein